MYKKFLNSLNLKHELILKNPAKDVYTAELNLNEIPFSSFGKGSDEQAAILSAYGEMCERILNRNYFEEYYINDLYPFMLISPTLNEKLYYLYKLDELEKEDLIDFNSDYFEIASIPFIEKSTNKVIYFPVNLIQNLYASNGMAVHYDFEKAYYNAKTEIIERYVKFDVIKYGLPLPKISHRYNTHNIQIYDATLGGKYPVMAASFIKDDKIILSFGCDIDQDKAIEKAYLELWQSGFEYTGTFNSKIEEIRSTYNLHKHFVNLSGDVHTNFLKAPYFKKAPWKFNSLDVFDKEEYFRITKTEDLVAVHLIIPGISEIYPFEDMIYNNINQGKLYYRDKVLNYEKYTKEEIYEIIDELKYSFSTELGALIGVKFEKPLFIDEFEEIYLQKRKPEFSKSYLNILELAKKLKELK